MDDEAIHVRIRECVNVPSLPKDTGTILILEVHLDMWATQHVASWSLTELQLILIDWIGWSFVVNTIFLVGIYIL